MNRKNKFQQETQLNKSEQQKFADKSLENSMMNVYDKIYWEQDRRENGT